MLTDLPIPTLKKRLASNQKTRKKIQIQPIVGRLPEPEQLFLYFVDEPLQDRCMINSHRTEREATIDPQTQLEDPMLDQFLSSFACTMEWRRSLGRG